MKGIFLLIAATVISCGSLFAQKHFLQGRVIDTAAFPIPFTTVSLLQPADSTLAFFGITNNDGEFDIRNVEKGTYLMQVAFMGFKTYYKPVDVPYKDGKYGAVVLQSLAKQLDEVQVTGERVPIMIKNDTVEYNAGAFKTKPDANVEELLKKMPGIQVDQSGNIKAQGENVSKLFVDGKEFFGNDPKVATQNLPADAINKVQVFNKKSDAAEFTGIDDGSREKTINLMLKDGKKVGYFGDVLAGAGTDERYKFNGKLYKFKPTSQFAVIGLMNNINEPGFSFQDYLNFSGGMRNLMSGNGLNLQFDESVPIDFGRPVSGLIHSGAAGINYSYEPKKNNRIAVSYLGNGADKTLMQQARTQNFTDNEVFVRNDKTDSKSQNFAHRLNLNIRKDMDSSNQLTIAGTGSLSDSRAESQLVSASVVRDAVLNRLDSRTEDEGSGIKGNLTASYLSSIKGKWRVFRAGGDVTYDKTLSRTEWDNLTTILSAPAPVYDMQFQRDNVMRSAYSVNTSVMRAIGDGRYLEPEIAAGYNIHTVNREQGIPRAELFDSLSPAYARQYKWIRPGVGFSNTSAKKQLNISLDAEAGTLSRELNGNNQGSDNYFFLLPSANWQYEYGTGKRLNANYTSQVTAPSGIQMLPVLNNVNPVQKYKGNDALKPEYMHRASINWLRFDQFNMTSLFANIGASYTADNISWARVINPDLTQTLMPVNVPYNFDVNGRVEYGTPVRKLHLNLNVSLTERYERGINLVNNTDNIANTNTHELRLTVDNRKKDKIDIQAGGAVSISSAVYSVYKDLNNTFYNFSGFAEINYNPSDRWNFNVSTDVTQYNAQSFDKAVLIPIVKAEASFYFLKNRKGVLTLYGFDLLDKNKGIERISELNYLRETTSNIIGRYVMLSFKYKIGKTGGGAVGDIDVKIRR